MERYTAAAISNGFVHCVVLPVLPVLHYLYSTIQQTYDAKIVKLGVRGPVHCLSYNIEKDILAFGVGNEVHSSRVDGKHSQNCSATAMLIINPSQTLFPKSQSILHLLRLSSQQESKMKSALAISISISEEIGCSCLIFVMAYGV